MHPTQECNLRRNTMSSEWTCSKKKKKREMLLSVRTKHVWSPVLLAEWCNPRLEESQSEQITENVSVIQFCGAAESGLWNRRKGPYVRRDSLLTLIQQWITSPVKSSDRHNASHRTPSSVFIFYFFGTLMRFDTAHDKNSHCVPPPRDSGLRLLDSCHH